MTIMIQVSRKHVSNSGCLGLLLVALDQSGMTRTGPLELIELSSINKVSLV